jgi:CDP-glycerol glycerophosphotransferase
VGRRLLRPTVSVIVPFYNVEDYLAECLDSILRQPFADFEVLLVDDGSPDGSREIAERYVEKDPRVRLLTRPNGGLGAARNTGIKAARGRYLTFVDSDDMLPHHALGDLVRSARASGADIVVGSVRRFDKDKDWRPGWVDRVQTVRRTAIRLEDFPPLLRNLYTWNKLFRKDFWDAQGLWFREGVAYEDQPVITQLYNRARAIDVIPEVVYMYRAREDKSSISQQTASLRDLRARLAAWDLTDAALKAEAPEHIQLSWLQTLFDSHFHWYLMSPGIADDTYWEETRASVLKFIEGAPQELWDRTPPLRRVLIELTRLGRRGDVQELGKVRSMQIEEDYAATPTTDGVLLHLPFFGDPELDQSLFLIRPEQLKVLHQVERIKWRSEDDQLFCELSGRAYIKKIDLTQYDAQVEIIVRGPRSGQQHVFASTERPAALFPLLIDDGLCDYTNGTFAVDLPMSEIVTSAPVEETWEVLLRVTAAGFTVTHPVTRLIRMGNPGGVAAGRLANGDRVAFEYRLFEPLLMRVLPSAVHASDLRLHGRVLSGKLTGPRGSDVAGVVATTGRRTVEERVRAGEFRLELPELPKRPATWTVSGRYLDDRPVGIVVDDVADSGGLLAQPDRLGELTVTDWERGSIADLVEATSDGRLVVTGRVYGEGIEAVAVTSRHKKARATGPQVATVGGTFKAELPLTYDVYRFGKKPLPLGDHDLRLLARVAGELVELPLPMGQALSDVLPVNVDTDHLEGRVVRGPDDDVRLMLVRPLGADGDKFSQTRLKTAAPKPGLTHGILFRSYFGEKATDNGLSIQAELKRRGSDLPCYWAVHDHSVVVPEGGIPVVVNSREWFELVSSVKYYVDNMYQPEYLQKQPGQVLVETFHGYPFKRMGLPHWTNMGFPRAQVESYRRRAEEWDYVVSPARYATPLLARDFLYDGEMLEIGYPRNDVLLSPQADAIRAAVRSSLDIKDHQTAVLYAPTFRDYLSVDDMRAEMVDFFDFTAAHAALGDDFVLLVRGHAFNARKNARVAIPGVLEVTDYPEVSDLYLASDAAIVDYSSLRFDYAVTGKPMIFHVPDLQRYVETRGWLFDFEPTAPGPLLDTTEELVAALQDLDGVRVKHQAEYDAFKADYLDLDDGHAGARFVDQVIVPRGDA